MVAEKLHPFEGVEGRWCKRAFVSAAAALQLRSSLLAKSEAVLAKLASLRGQIEVLSEALTSSAVFMDGTCTSFAEKRLT